MNESKILCLDLGGTSLKCALIRGGKILKRFRVPTDAARGLEGILKTFRAALDRFADDGYEGIAVSSAGTVDSERGVVTYATALLPGYTGFALKDWFTAQTGKPCACVNDGYAAALCESASFGDETCAVLTLGTGVGGAYVKNGEIDPIASQGIGHLCFRPEGRARRCKKPRGTAPKVFGKDTAKETEKQFPPSAIGCGSCVRRAIFCMRSSRFPL